VPLHRAQVHLQSAPEYDGRAGVALGLDLRHLVVGDEARDGGGRLPGRDQDVQVVLERVNPLRSDTGKAQQLGQVRRQLALQLLERLAGAGPDDFPDLSRQGLADAGQLGQIRAGVDHLGQLLGEPPQLPGGIAVGADAKGVLAADLQQIRDLVEYAGDVLVVYGHLGWAKQRIVEPSL
jgi:hypothetical protein